MFVSLLETEVYDLDRGILFLLLLGLIPRDAPVVVPDVAEPVALAEADAPPTGESAAPRAPTPPRHLC